MLIRDSPRDMPEPPDEPWPNSMGRSTVVAGVPGGCIILVEQELHLGPHVVVPDLAGWKRERLTPFPETAFIEAPPDWLCEVLSPATQAIDRTDKLKVYAAFGVKHCWYIDLIVRTLEVLTFSGANWTIAATFKNADPVTAPPFEVHTFQLDALWIGDAPQL